MERCYDGALVMPSSYAVMDEEEMTYVEGGRTSKIYRASEALTYLSNQVKLCTAESAASLAVAGVGAATIIVAVVGGLASALMGQWASAYASAKTTIERQCRKAGNKKWLVGIDEEVFLGWLTVTLW